MRAHSLLKYAPNADWLLRTSRCRQPQGLRGSVGAGFGSAIHHLTFDHRNFLFQMEQKISAIKSAAGKNLLCVNSHTALG
jgi:hypothetical protein